MAAKNLDNAAGATGGGKAEKEVSRGTQDEMEIIMLIVAENPSLKQAVLEKVRQTKYRLGMQKKSGADEGSPAGKAAKAK